MTKIRYLLTIVVLGCTAPIRAETIDVTTAIGSGPTLQFRQGVKADPPLSSFNTFLTGRANDRIGPRTYRGYLIFNLSAVTMPVSSAEIRLIQGVVETPDPFETVNVHDVTTPIAELFSTSSAAAIYDDLASGVFYGSGSDYFDGADNSTIKSIFLNAAGINAINANLGGVFAVGLSLDSIIPRQLEKELIGFRGTFPPPALRLTLVPEPSAFAIGATSLFAVSAIRRRASIAR